jgi:hypothetical protein
MVKSSLPFFRSKTMVQAEALVSRTGGRTGVPFPLAYGLPDWVRPVLDAAGFQKADLLTHCSVVKFSYKQASARELEWDRKSRVEGTDELLRNTGAGSGLECSQVRLAVSMANAGGYLKTISRGGQTMGLVGYKALGKHGFVTVSAYDSKSIDVAEFGAAILRLCADDKVKAVHFVLVGQGQSDLVNSVGSLCRSPLKKEELQLMRKVL